MKYIVLFLIIISIGYGLYKIINKIIVEFNNLRIKNYKNQLYKAQIKNQYYEKINNNIKNNYRKNFGIEEEKNWREYWNGYKPKKEKNIIEKIFLFIIKTIWKLIKLTIYCFILLLLIAIFNNLKN